MRSTFMGLETSKRGIYTQQSALYTTGHNISNANTLGYSRQRVNMQATSGFPGVGLNTPTMPGFLGTGVEAGSIQRIRDGFVDHQFRSESNKLGYWESQTKAIGQLEDVLAEPSAYGLQGALSQFWQSLEGLASNPENGGARAVVVERGKSVADSFNYIYNSLKEIQGNLKNEIDVGAKQINSVLKQIGDLNKQIGEVEPNGYMPNDLYDERDRLLDELAEYFPIKVTYDESGGNALKIAQGIATVQIQMDGEFVTVVKGKEFAEMKGFYEGTGDTPPFSNVKFGKLDKDGNLTVQYDKDMNVVPNSATDAEKEAATYSHSQLLDAGRFKSLINSYGTDDGKGLYPENLKKLDQMAQEFAKAFNAAHQGDPTGNPPVYATDLNGDPGEAFFVSKTGDPITAQNISINQTIADDPNKVAASDSEGKEVGNGKNAQKLGEIQFIPLDGLGNKSVQGYYSGDIIGTLGVKGQQAINMTKNSATLLGAVSNRRDSISSVSLDEEMTDMIRFQQAYNASARMITVMDETLDKIINGMGVVGR
ncbi:flagellar hook-associated protein FlgK [Sporosarcina sp. Sa2YVA2]|uniref:Flagellar hook-associated protein 1 n=1 Tax=Sporosarcina quadrami TaxID=2762234 RepID=A0ABR8UBL1_9BACL|nr:flagellar hook-associated protein FlgK [Sporosarcina quadrami]MBD7985185.1 flagellar hook-associated protein FlgK [Sporosarcina quadrami]